MSAKLLGRAWIAGMGLGVPPLLRDQACPRLRRVSQASTL